MAARLSRYKHALWLGSAAVAAIITASAVVGTATPGHGAAAMRWASTTMTAGAVGTTLGVPANALSAATATPAPTAAPAPPAAASAAPRPAPAVALAPPASYRNRLTGPDGLNTGVGVYSDCNGQTPLPGGYASIDTCVTAVLFFVGHNPGVFTPLLSMSVGDVITYWDGAGTAHPLRIISVRNWVHTTTPSVVPGATTEFQTCITSDGSLDRVLDAAPA